MTENNTTTANNDSNVTIHYKGSLEDGSEFDNSYTRGEPITVTLGSGQLIPGFNDAVVGMTTGETKTITLSPEDAYGEVNPEAKTQIAKSNFPSDLELTTGMAIPLRDQLGRVALGKLIEHDDENVTIDLNHPLAGQTLQFDIELLEVNTTNSTDEEIAT